MHSAPFTQLARLNTYIYTLLHTHIHGEITMHLPPHIKLFKNFFRLFFRSRSLTLSNFSLLALRLLTTLLPYRTHLTVVAFNALLAILSTFCCINEVDDMVSSVFWSCASVVVWMNAALATQIAPVRRPQNACTHRPPSRRQQLC